jgi:hypothetical protein
MIIRRLLSDQLYNWSDIYDETVVSHIAKTAECPDPGPAAPGTPPARIVDRTLQTLRKAGLSLRQRTRARPQVLPVGQPDGRPARDGLRASRSPRTGRGGTGEPPARPADTERDLPDQPRTASSSRTPVGNTDVFRPGHPRPPGGHGGRQHDPRPAEGRAAGGVYHGGAQ